MPANQQKRKVLDVSSEHHERLQKLAKKEGMSLRRYTSLILEATLPIAEQGGATISAPKMTITNEGLSS